MTAAPADVRVNNFDLIRLVAAGQVVMVHGIHHVWGPATSPWWEWMLETVPGVPIFFTVSGFLISMSFERVGGLPTYLQNRFLRIYPGLWGCLAVSLLSVIVFGDVDWRAVGLGPVGAWLAAQVSFAQFFNPGWLRDYGVGVLNGSLWTIPVELQFYIVLPVAYAVLGLGAERRRNAHLIATTVLFWVVNAVFMAMETSAGDRLWYKLLGVSFVPHIYLFFLGVLAQRNWRVVSGWVAGKVWWWAAIYATVATAMHLGGLRVGTNTPHPLGVLPLVGLVFALAFTLPTLADRLLHRNDISYGLYIYHMPVANVLVAIGMTGAAFLILPLAGVTALLAFLSWRLIERPALRFKRRSVHAVD